MAPDAELPERVWTARGDETWEWVAGEWRLADRQPHSEFEVEVAAVCVERGHHELTIVDTAHAVCDDCGYAYEVVPDDYSSEAWETVRFGYRPTTSGI